jgi:predicted  nucleic acid-binding Zn-ribbon protein
MLQDLTRDQSDAAKAEKERIKACQGGTASLTKEIGALQNTLAGLDARLGELAQIEADAREDFVAAKEAHGNAVEFLGKLDTQCTQNDDDFKSRSASRAEELAALTDTIEILNNDDAFKTLGALGKSDPANAVPVESFLQMGKQGFKVRNQAKNDVINTELRNSAVSAIDAFAKKDARTFLVQYLIKSAAVDKGAIKKVQDKIDVLVKELQVKQNEEITMRAECIDDYNNLKLDMEAKMRDKETQEEEIENLTNELDMLKSSIEELTTDTESLKKEAAEASEQRTKDNVAFQKLVKEHSDVQEILKKAIARMNVAYSNMKAEYALDQQQPGADFTKIENTVDTPGSGPAAFTNEGATTKNQKGGNKVITLLKEVMADSEKTASDATKAESDAQNAYEQFMAETDRSIA